jgi:hypothetical protein
VVLGGALCAGLAGAAKPRPYWSFSYEEIDVMTPEDGAHARALAHNVHRVEVAARRLLGLSSATPLPPTHIYALHHPTYALLAPPDQWVGSINLRLFVPFEFVVHDGENYAMLDAEQSNQSEGAYFGLAGSILARQKVHFPEWFTTGFARLISQAHLNGSKVFVGEPDPWLARVLRSRKLKFIPTRQLLTMSPDDPALQKSLMKQEYIGECWLLVHAITVEGLHEAEFARYLQLLTDRKSPPEAFAASFKGTYEDLDRMLADILARGVIRTLAIEVPDEADSGQPRQLTPAESQERIIKLAGALQGDQPLHSDRDGESLPGSRDDSTSAGTRRAKEWRARRDSNPRPSA